MYESSMSLKSLSKIVDAFFANAFFILEDISKLVQINFKLII